MSICLLKLPFKCWITKKTKIKHIFNWLTIWIFFSKFWIKKQTLNHFDWWAFQFMNYLNIDFSNFWVTKQTLKLFWLIGKSIRKLWLFGVVRYGYFNEWLLANNLKRVIWIKAGPIYYITVTSNSADFE